jgi:hypothetical protein
MLQALVLMSENDEVGILLLEQEISMASSLHIYFTVFPFSVSQAVSMHLLASTMVQDADSWALVHNLDVFTIYVTYDRRPKNC